jgi:DNA-binding LacI/PurR family transcriptional regulator
MRRRVDSAADPGEDEELVPPSHAAVDGRRVAIATSFIESRYWTTVIEGIVGHLRSEGVVPVCFTLGDRSGQAPLAPDRHPLYQLVRPENVHGLIVLAPAAFPDGAERFCRRHGDIPIVSVGQRLPSVPSVWLHNSAGIKAGMEHLVERCGRRRIAFLRGPSSNAEAEARFRAYEDLCVELSLGTGPELVAQGDFTEVSGYEATRLLIEQHLNSVDAIFAANDLMALGALRAAHDVDVGVPDRLAIMGFDDLEARFGDPPLSTVRQPTRELGERAAEFMVRQLRGEEVPLQSLFLPEVVVRATCGAPRLMRREVPEPREPAPPPEPVFVSLGEAVSPQAAGKTDMARAVRAKILDSLKRRRKLREEVEEMLDTLDELNGGVQARAELAESTLRAVREQALEGLARALAATEHLHQVQDAVEPVLPALSVDGLFLVGLGGAQSGTLVVGVRNGAPAPGVGCQVDPGRVFASIAPRNREPDLWLVLPVEDARGAVGFLAAHGKVFDVPALARMCALLAPALQRILSQARV